MPLLHPFRLDAPHLTSLRPRAAIPGGSFELTGTHLLPTTNDGPHLPEAFFGDTPASLDLARPTRALVRVPHGAISSDLTLRTAISTSNPLHASIGVPMVEDLHMISNPAADADGNLFAMVSGPRGEQVPVSIFNIAPPRSGSTPEIFVFATLEPSVAFYHLCFRADGTLLVTAPTTSSHQPIYAISPDGSTGTFFRGLGRPQGMALDVDDNLYIAASLHGSRGIVRITPSGQAELIVAGNDLVGICFLDDGCAALATNTTIFHTDLGIEGRPLI